MLLLFCGLVLFKKKLFSFIAVEGKEIEETKVTKQSFKLPREESNETKLRRRIKVQNSVNEKRKKRAQPGSNR
ncbi:hypothetical protein L2E82_22470 [Cichorium intybus]|uniref:Uncharacterized protein n=1 Tax=Cichorium intybus TaxID=13427 RepID=A0ACB9DY47_CICIN|nr:hypothetical protein L2E82_22470 [Cichorium intybus]